MDTTPKSKHLLSKKRRRRTVINSKDLEKLECLFRTSKWPDRVQKGKLSKAIGKTENFISTWFQNRRARMRRLARQKDLLDDVDVTLENASGNGAAVEKPLVKRMHKYRSRSAPPLRLNLEVIKTDNSISDVDGYQTDNSVSKVTELDYTRPEAVGEEITTTETQLSNIHSKTGHMASSMEPDFSRGTVKKSESIPHTFVKAPNDIIPSERRILVDTPSSGDASSWDNIFRRIIDMMAAAESIMSKSDTSFPFAVKDAALGIRLKDGKIYYSKEYGLDFEDYA